MSQYLFLFRLLFWLQFYCYLIIFYIGVVFIDCLGGGNMTKQEFLDKVDQIRVITQTLFVTESDNEEWQQESKEVIKMLDKLKDDAEQLLDDECDTAYQLGLNRGWNHEDGGDF